MIAWYSRDRSSFSRSISCCRVTVVSAIRIVSVMYRRLMQTNERAGNFRGSAFCSSTTSMMCSIFSRSQITVALVAATAVAAAAQTRIVPPPNNYTPAQDVELGRKAAADARQQLPVMRDDLVSSFIDGLGKRLVAAIPQELRHPEFEYTFEPVNVREINAFALPGGPMFVNRGMIEAAHTEGEVAGVMAHELSHVALRHGTAQASKATKYEVGQVAGAVLGAIIGGGWGQVVSQGTPVGLGTAFPRLGPEYERP